MTISDDAVAVSAAVATGLAGVSLTLAATLGSSVSAFAFAGIPLVALLLIVFGSVEGDTPNVGVES